MMDSHLPTSTVWILHTMFPSKVSLVFKYRPTTFSRMEHLALSTRSTSCSTTNLIHLVTSLNSLNILAKFKLQNSDSRNHKSKPTTVYFLMRCFTVSLKKKNFLTFITIACSFDQNFNHWHNKTVCILRFHGLLCFFLTGKWLYLPFSARSGLLCLYPSALTILITRWKQFWSRFIPNRIMLQSNNMKWRHLENLFI